MCACHLKISWWFPVGVDALACTQPFCVVLNKPDNFRFSSSTVTYFTFICTTEIPFRAPHALLSLMLFTFKC